MADYIWYPKDTNFDLLSSEEVIFRWSNTPKPPNYRDSLSMTWSGGVELTTSQSQGQHSTTEVMVSSVCVWGQTHSRGSQLSIHFASITITKIANKRLHHHWGISQCARPHERKNTCQEIFNINWASVPRSTKHSRHIFLFPSRSCLHFGCSGNCQKATQDR